MALSFLNRCGFRATSTGTGSFVVASALTGMQTPAQAAGPAVVNANTYRYFAQSDDLTQWEYGYGVYTTGDVTLTRATVLDNSSGGTTALSFSAAPKVFMGGPLAQDMPIVSASGTFTDVTDAVPDVVETSNELTITLDGLAVVPAVARALNFNTLSITSGIDFQYKAPNTDNWTPFYWDQGYGWVNIVSGTQIRLLAVGQTEGNSVTLQWEFPGLTLAWTVSTPA